MRAGDMSTFEQLKELYVAADSAVEESMLLGAMGSGSTVELVYAALDFNLTESVRWRIDYWQLRGQPDWSACNLGVGTAVSAPVTRNKLYLSVCGRPIWPVRAAGALAGGVLANWDSLEKRFGGGGVSSILTRIVGASCSGLASEADAVAVEKFYSSKETPGIERTVTQATEAIRARAARLERDADKVAGWLAVRYP
eukprot:6998840-Pyramimonas_sp.AAC.1